VAEAFGLRAECVSETGQIDQALHRGLAANEPYFIEVMTRLTGVPPRGD
jgi:acetolactate synthase-1/2/3 large subunit